MCRALLALTALHARGLVAWAIRGDRRLCGSWLSVPPAPRVRGGCSWGFWLEQEHADHPPVVMDALDLVSVALELGHDGGREVNPAGMQSGKSDRLVAGPVQPLLLGVSERHRPDCRPAAGAGRHRLLGGSRFLWSVFTT